MQDQEFQFDERSPGAARSVAVTGLVVALACVLARGVAAADAFPWWSDDPTVIAVPLTGLPPVGSLVLSVLTIIGSCLAVLAAHGLDHKAGRTSSATGVESLLLLAGTLGAAAHGLWLAGGSLDDLQTGLAWASAMSAGAAASACSRDPALRRLILACLLGGLVMVAVKAGLQVFVEHPATVASFEANKDAVLASHGWSPGSPMARSFEHRLRQPDATTWFGLSNVVATFGAAASVMALGFLTRPKKPEDARGGPAGVLGALTLLAGAGAMLVLGGSKGGYAGAAVGLSCVAAAGVGRRRPALAKLLPWAPLAAVVAVLAAVVARGLIGEHSGERSLLFRSYYLEAGWRIFSTHLPWGTGPTGFRDAYLTAKNPLNPEEITSTHNLPADFACTLGLAGLAWAALWLWWVARLGPALVPDSAQAREAPAEPANVKEEFKPAFLVLCAATIVGVWLESAASTPEAAAARLGGLVLALLAAGGVLIAADRPWARVSVAAGAVTLAVLGLIDMAGVHPSSAPWYAMLLAAAGGPLVLPFAATLPVRPIAAAAAALGAFAGLARLSGVLAWQSSLREAFTVVAGASKVRNDLEDLMRGRVKPGTPEEQAAMERLTNAGITGLSAAEAVRKAEELSLAAWMEALPHLVEASTQQPSHSGTREAACQLQLRIASALKEAGRAEAAREAASGVLALSVPLAIGRPAGPGTMSWQAAAIEGAYRLRGDTAKLWLPECVRLLKAAHEHDPYSLNHPAKLVALYEEFGPPEEAAIWAKEILKLDEFNRMDPSGTRKLTDEQRARYKSLAEKGAASPAPDPVKTRPGG